MKRVNAAELDLIARGRPAAPAGHGRAPWTRLLASGSVWSLCLMYGFGAFSATFFITWLPDYLRDTRHLSPQEMQWLSGLPLACGVVACLVGGVASDAVIRRTGNRKWGRRFTGLVGHACAGLALLATNWVDEVWLLGCLLSATFFFNDLAMGPAWACCADIGGRYAGTLGGTMNMVGNFGAALMAVVVGYLFGQVFTVRVGGAAYALVGNTLVFVIFACSFWLAALCWLGVNVERPLEAEPEP
jgi:nitrate/nitrite transporter NarK